MGNNEPAVDQSDLRIRGSYGLNYHRYYTSRNVSISIGLELIYLLQFLSIYC